MKKLPMLLNTPVRAVIAVSFVILVGEFLIMLLIEGIHTATLQVGFLGNVAWKFVDPIMLAAFVAPALYFLIFRALNQQAELERQLDELRRFQKLTIGRELRIKELVEEFFVKMGIPAEVRDLSKKDNTVLVGIKAEDPQELIGERGKTLCEIQRLLMSIAKRQIDEPFFLDLDINDYKKKKAEYLTEMAVSLANDVALDGRERELPVMLAMERRVVHMALARRTDVATESVGEEPERRIIIKVI